MGESELIRLAAMKVMGWAPETLDDWLNVWNPLEDIADAWMLVEKIRKDSSGVMDFVFEWLQDPVATFGCECSPLPDGFRRSRANEREPSRAITIAALRCVGAIKHVEKW